MPTSQQSILSISVWPIQESIHVSFINYIVHIYNNDELHFSSTTRKVYNTKLQRVNFKLQGTL